MNKITIEVCTRLSDYWSVYTTAGEIRLPKYHACIKDKKGYWSCGRSIEEAVNGLRDIDNEMFKGGIEQIIYLGKLAR